MDELWLGPLFAAIAYLVVVRGLYWLGGVLGEKSDSSPDKHLPYSGGEPPIEIPYNLGYQAFFRLALFFAILHVAALVLSTLSSGGTSDRVAIVYLVGIGISVFVLIGGDDG